MTLNQNPEQLARDKIDGQLAAAGWVVQAKKKIDFSAGVGVAVREYQTSYILFVEGKPASVLLERIRAERTAQQPAPRRRRQRRVAA